MNTSLQIKTLTRDDILTHLDALADILENCVRAALPSVLCCHSVPIKLVLSGRILPGA